MNEILFRKLASTKYFGEAATFSVCVTDCFTCETSTKTYKWKVVQTYDDMQQ